MTLKISDEGLRPYVETLEKQRRLFYDMVERKKTGIPVEEEHIILVEHPPVITLGRHAKESNILINGQELHRHGIQIHHIERGGDVTYHAPGQLVAYPILDLEHHRLGVRDYVELLEETVIRTIAEFGICGGRIAGASGVWVGVGTPSERKICALGVKCSRYITMHGLALNVTTDLSGFRLINPCGFIDKGVTSMENELRKPISIKDVKHSLTKHFKVLLNL